MRKRIKKGVLVASTENLRAIKAKRLVIEITYSFKRGIISEKIIDVRQTVNY